MAQEQDKQLVFHMNEFLNNESLSHKRRKNFAPKELNIIISMVEENADLIYNRVNRNPTYHSKQDFWMKVTQLINESCHFAAKRDVKEVRRKWVTYQSEVKSKGKEGAHLLNEHEKRVLELIQENNQLSDIVFGGGILPPAEQTHKNMLTMLPSTSSRSSPSSSDTKLTMLPITGCLKQASQVIDSLTQKSILSTGTISLSQPNSASTFPTSLQPRLSSPDAGIINRAVSNVSINSTAPIPAVLKTERVSEAEYLMNICSQVIGELSDLPQQVDITPKPTAQIVSTAQNFSSSNTSTAVSAASVASVATPAVTPTATYSVTPTATYSVTPTRSNIVSVQPVNHIQTPPKRPRLDVSFSTPLLQTTPIQRVPQHTAHATDSLVVQRVPQQIPPDSLVVQRVPQHTPTDSLMTLIQQISEHQQEANRLAEQRLLIEQQRRDIEQEKLEVEKARYELEKERLCQEIISRKK